MSSPRILVIGASGMLGHVTVRVLAQDFEVWGACRDPRTLPALGVPVERILGGLDAASGEAAYDIVGRVKPDLVVNAAGIVKQRAAAKSATSSIAVNSLWPHVLADACAAHGARMVHVSTDCVFSGTRGNYVESDVPDAVDLYGRSKLLGEIADLDHVVTLRTSIIGWQLEEPTGLVAWFAAHRAQPLSGFTKAIFSGLTTRALTEVIRDVIMRETALSGLWHVSAAPIDKYTLLSDLAKRLGWAVDISPTDKPSIDRSLDSALFRDRTGWIPPGWDDMLEGLAGEWSWYARQ